MFIRYKMDIGKICQHLGGDLTGQTQVAYCKHELQEFIPFSHPVDLHFAMTGLQVSILCQSDQQLSRLIE